LEDPFNPYALADLHREIYRVSLTLGKTENLLDWADTLFTRDTTEAVNRARSLYRLAAETIALAQWPAEGCVIDVPRALAQATPSLGPHQQSRIRACITQIEMKATSQTQREVQQAVSGRSAPFRIAAIEALARKSNEERRRETLKPLLELRKTKFDQASPTQLKGKTSIALPAILQLLNKFNMNNTPNVDFRFCLPPNPLANVFKWRIESNLAKIQTNRNFAGMPRQLQAYATPVDPNKLVKQAAAGGLEFEEYVPSLPPPIYRYSFLTERAKQLTQAAQQLEASTLSAIEKEDEANYRVIQARQDVRLERANVTLQNLRVAEASDGLQQATLQKQRAGHQRDHFSDLIQKGVSGAEAAALVLMMYSTELHLAAALASGFTNPGQSISSAAAATGTASSVSSTIASYDRRQEEWEFQLQLGNDDVAIADVGMTIASDHIDIANQEKNISDLRLEGANDTVEFLQDRFSNAALYHWMNRELRHLYREQLNLAISTAKAAQRALEFERQTSLDFIAYDYWDDTKGGMVGAERLLVDIEKMNQFRLANTTRKKEIEKTISLASKMPAEFQAFRRTGVLDFETSTKWFDRDFPGHYMRVIRDVNVTVLALVPPNEGIHATLSNPGLSRIMVGAPWEQYSTIYRLPESIALSSANRAAGVFELRPDDPMLWPFEGSCVASTWRLEMPRGANRFQYETIFDVLFTIRYTALEDRDYRAKVLAEMGQDDDGFVKTGAVRYFSLRNDYPDQWYQLLNPVLDAQPGDYWQPTKDADGRGKPQLPYTMMVDLGTADFVPNEDGRKIKKITLALQVADGQEGQDFTLPLNTSKVRFQSDSVIDEGTATSKLTIVDFTARIEDFNGKAPYGRWVFCLGDACNAQTPPQPARELADKLKKYVKDLWLIVEYEAKVHYNR
jgi:hypothetical protein